MEIAKEDSFNPLLPKGSPFEEQNSLALDRVTLLSGSRAGKVKLAEYLPRQMCPVLDHFRHQFQLFSVKNCINLQTN